MPVLRFPAALVLVTAALAVAAPGMTAQSDADRPSVALTRQPDFSHEVWPADFNEDGITDLVAGRVVTVPASTSLLLAIGRGDGTFEEPVTFATGVGTPAGVGDLNADGLIDIVTSGGVIFAGRGDATFVGPAAGPGTIAAPTEVVDMNGDGHADLVSKLGSLIGLYPGNGDFTFGARTTVSAGSMSEAMITGDFNGDGLRDIATTTREAQSRVNVFINQGDLTFGLTSMLLPAHGGGITARDVNGDGRLDLAVGIGQYNFITDFWLGGAVLVFLGNGDGTFASPLQFPTNAGPIRVVAGDFNGDGVQDIATGNRSSVEHCESIGYLWDSVSILPGRGDGTLGPPASFALSYPRALHRLNTSDLNGDGRTDLIASPGTVLLLGPSAPNRPPIADAGSDREEPLSVRTSFRGSATDPDHDWLTFEWRDDFGRVVSDLPNACVPAYEGTHTFTLTARDGRGGESSDSMQWTFTSGTTPPPAGFQSENIGDVGAPGGSRGLFEVIGAGADIWGTSDAFRFVHTTVSGDFEVMTRITRLTNTHPWAKGGLMIRQSLSPDSRHAFVFATPTAMNGVAFQRREFDGGTTVHTQGPFIGIDSWLRLVREGAVISAHSRVNESDPWELIGTQTLSGLTDPVHVGLAVTSHDRDTATTANFLNFGVTPLSGTLPDGWASADVGSVALAGTAIVQAGSWRVQGSGADIWGTQDAFHYTYARLPDDGILTARLASWSGPDDWTKAGVMIRESLDPAAAHHFLLASEGRVLAYQQRPEAGGTTLHTGLSTTLSAPVWLRIQRIGGVVRLFYARTFATPASWTLVAESPLASGEVLIGFAVTSHADGQFGTGTFDNVSFSPGTAVPPSVALTAPADGATLVLGGRISVTATATDPDDGVREVHFEIESPTGWDVLATRLNSLGTDTTFALQYQPIDVGSRRLRARAVDHGGLSSVSNVVNLHVVDIASAGWTSADVGAIGIAGSTAGLPPNTVTMTASGTDIWGTADAFRFTYFTMAFSGTLTARVAALDAPHAWTKAGVMLRLSTEADSPHAFMFVSRDHGLAFQRRTATGAATVHTGAAGGAAPQWVRLRRTGDLVTASFSADGVQWTDVGSEVLPLGTGPVLVGVALTSHDNASLATAMFDNVVVSR